MLCKKSSLFLYFAFFHLSVETVEVEVCFESDLCHSSLVWNALLNDLNALFTLLYP